MSIILEREAGRVICKSGLPCPDDAEFAIFGVPRSLEEERALIERLSEERWAGLVLTGTESPADIEKASSLLRVAEAHRSLPSPSLLIVARLDTAKAALGLVSFNRRISSLAGLLIDRQAIAAAAGVSADSALVRDLEMRLPLAAKACGAAAILAVTDRRYDEQSLAAAAGYDGVFYTGSEHPRGIENA